ncbi:MAG: 30S ribosomal protein S17 [Candidatus Sumerlaeia bacterium]
MSNDMNNQPGHRKTRTGMVVSNKMDRTIIVNVERLIKHPLVKKYVRRHKKYYAHDAENTCNVGDKVRIEECRPLSKMKRWKLAEIIDRAK